MKKNLIINLADGRKIVKDLTHRKDLPIGEPANCEVYAKICQAVCQFGYSDVDKCDSKRYVHIAPSQITSAEVVFIDSHEIV